MILAFYFSPGRPINMFSENFYLNTGILSLKLIKYFVVDAFLARLLILIKKGGLLQLKFGVVGVGVGVNIYLWAQ